ncbi:MAG TPA: penicillin-binding protein 2 [Gammaproteobacteria bacterium]|nr:penicillin-binding protein 2 [Gammaproteobacteria bacterium]
MARQIQIKDHLLESRLFMRRTVAALIISVLLVLALIARLVFLQVISHQHFTTLSRDNRVKLLPIPPTRGLIYDRNGVLLAENLPSYRLEIIPEQVKNMKATIAALSKIINIRDIDIQRFNELRRRKHPFDAIPLRFHLSDAEVARFAVNRYRFPGVDVEAGLTRYYPLGPEAVHAVGYVGRIDARELQEVNQANYRGTSHIGKTGVERSYEKVLHGKVGYQQVETNAEGRIVRVLSRTPPVPGHNLYLTLDAHLQAVTEKAFGDNTGAAVALNPKTGAILAMVSMPEYNPNPFVNGIELKDYRALQNHSGRPLFNRALRGQYAPGSTIKPFVGLGGLEDDVTKPDTTTFCPGYYQLPGSSHKYRCWKRWGHGNVDITQAITQSCDVYFYNLAHEMGIDRLHNYLARFGFGKRTGVDLVGELPGLLPSRQWKERVRHQPWFPGETLITGIGQGFLLVTPLQLAAATATMAEKGLRAQLHLVAAEQNPANGNLDPTPIHMLPRVPEGDPKDWNLITKAMEDVVNSPHGTAHQLKKEADYTIAAKTGTAQVFGLGQKQTYNPKELARRLRDNALFIAFAPAPDPRIAVAVIVEHGGGGSSAAAPIALKIMNTYLNGGKKDDKP